jgi:phosphatidylserine/phosphatidylglycerophosphate/cardiolipin synthase-like enzyme
MTQDGDMAACFVTEDDCAAFVAAQIDRAQKTLIVSAYNFSESRIINAIVRAKQRRDDKVLMIAGHLVLTGSFNFSSHALRNSENANAIDRPVIAAAYGQHIPGSGPARAALRAVQGGGMRSSDFADQRRWFVVA